MHSGHCQRLIWIWWECLCVLNAHDISYRINQCCSWDSMAVLRQSLLIHVLLHHCLEKRVTIDNSNNNFVISVFTLQPNHNQVWLPKVQAFCNWGADQVLDAASDHSCEDGNNELLRSLHHPIVLSHADMITVFFYDCIVPQVNASSQFQHQSSDQNYAQYLWSAQVQLHVCGLVKCWDYIALKILLSSMTLLWLSLS